MSSGPAHYTWNVRALTVPGPDSDLCLFLSFDNERYIIGCGEGAQRAFVQKRVSLRQTTGILVPGGGSAGRSGLPGLLMTAADHGINKVNVIGPPDISHYLATLRGSLYRQTIDVITHAHPFEVPSSKAERLFKGRFLDVRSIALRSQRPVVNPTSSSSTPSSPNTDITRSRIQHYCDKIVKDMFCKPHKASFARADPTKPLRMPLEEDTATDMVYICQGSDIMGKFDNAKAVQLGVPNGPIRSRLVKGESIEFPDPKIPGQTVTVKPEDVVSGGAAGPIIMLVNCSEATMPSLLESTAFDAYRSSVSSPVSLIVHRCPPSVWQNSDYQDWMSKFGPSVQHLIANPSEEVVFAASAWNTLKLSLLDEELFSLPHLPTPIAPALPPNSTLLQPNHSMRLHPKGELSQIPNHEKDLAFPSTPEELENAKTQVLSEQPEFAAECSSARKAVREDPRWCAPEDGAGSDITITTLGTGSALPSKHRNVSCTHLDIPGIGGVILDAGEGSIGQLRRRFGDRLKDVLSDLKAVFISHMHADHHLGLHAVLEERFKYGIQSKLYLISPVPIALSLSESGPWQFDVPQEALDNLVWIDNAFLKNGTLTKMRESSPTSDDEAVTPALAGVEIPRSYSYDKGWQRWPSTDIIAHLPITAVHCQQAVGQMMRDLGLVGLRTPTMKHRGKAWGLIMEHSSGWKVSYSGDTMPSRIFVKSAYRSTLMIHEATLEDDKADMAKEKGHSTFSQAIDVGNQAEVSHILLNHFSQRYPKLPRSKYQAGEGHNAVVSVSFDFMSVKVRDMWRMSYYMDAMEMLFPPEEEDGEGEDTIEAVAADFNATIDSKGGKKGQNGRKKKAEKRASPGEQNIESKRPRA